MLTADMIGGQAVIEGVMMRTPNTYTIAVRTSDGEISVKKEKYTSLTKRYKKLSYPLIRGFIILIETMYIGISALSFSGEVAMLDEESDKVKKEKSGIKEKLSLSFAILLAFLFGLLLFTFIPYFLSEVFQKSLDITRDTFTFNIVAGIVRIVIFIGYLWLITRMKDIQRVFEYHGAEHKSIYAFEANETLNVENASTHSTKHPRCGTSFILVVLIAAICIYILFDSIVTMAIGHRPTLIFRILSHIAILPLIAGTAYEFTKWSGKQRGESKFVKLAILPGLWLQKITTREPSADQLEVALTALKTAINLERDEFQVDMVPSTGGEVCS